MIWLEEEEEEERLLESSKSSYFCQVPLEEEDCEGSCNSLWLEVGLGRLLVLELVW